MRDPAHRAASIAGEYALCRVLERGRWRWVTQKEAVQWAIEEMGGRRDERFFKQVYKLLRDKRFGLRHRFSSVEEMRADMLPVEEASRASPYYVESTYAPPIREPGDADYVEWVQWMNQFKLGQRK